MVQVLVTKVKFDQYSTIPNISIQFKYGLFIKNTYMAATGLNCICVYKNKLHTKFNKIKNVNDKHA